MKQNENILSKLQSKKVLFVLSLFLIPAFFFFIFLQYRNVATEKEPSTAVEPTKQAANVPSPTVTPSIQKWNTYKNDTFSIQFPPQWEPLDHQTDDGGLIVTYKSTELPEGINYPQFLLQKQPVSTEALAMKKEILKGLGLKESKTKVDKIDATKFSGTIPFKAVGNQNVSEPIQDTTILVEAKGFLYILKYEYEGSEQNKDLELYFDDFIASFKVD